MYQWSSWSGWSGWRTSGAGASGVIGDLPWWLWLLFGLSCIAVGVVLVVWPALLSFVVASVYMAAGIAILTGAVAAGWDAWEQRRHRPRRIRIRRG